MTNLHLRSSLVFLLACLPAAAQSAPVEYLPVCAKCLNPRVTAKTGIGTATAVAEAKVALEDAKAWCASNKPRDPGCVRYEVAQGGDGARPFYRATANCSTGRLTSMNGGQYVYAGVWPSGPGRGRPMLRDLGGNIRRWDDVVYGTGKPRAEWDTFGGMSLSGQWEVLCAGAAPPAAAGPAAAPAPAQPAVAATPQLCGGQPMCAESNSFAATITDFRTSAAGRTKVATASIRFQNKLGRPVILGYVSGSGVTTDDQGNRYVVAAPDSVRGIGLIANGQVDPKFVIRQNESGDARFEMVWGWSGREVFGLNFEMELTVRELMPLPSGQFRMGPEHPLRFRGLANAVSSAAPVSAAPATAAAPVSAASPVAAAPIAAAPVIASGPDPCSGIARCFNAGTFLAEVQQISSSVYGGRHHILRFNVRFRNLTNQPLILASTYNSSAAVDNLGNRYAITPDQAVSGMGVVARNSADPQFVLAPGQTRNAAFQVYRRNSGQPTGASYTFDVSLEQLEILPSQQVRSTRQFSLNFPNLTVSAMSGAAPAAGSLTEAGKKIGDLFKTKK